MGLAAGYPEELRRILDGFGEINRKVFRAFARTPDYCCVVTCHNDICMTAGPVCSPDWLRKYIYPILRHGQVSLHLVHPEPAVEILAMQIQIPEDYPRRIC